MNFLKQTKIFISMKKFFLGLFSDSNKVSSKRFIGILSKIMFLAYGVKGLLEPFNLQFAVFYVSLCSVTVWIAFRFMSSEKALKYNILGQLGQLGGINNLKKNTEELVNTEKMVDESVQPQENN